MNAPAVTQAVEKVDAVCDRRGRKLKRTIVIFGAAGVLAFLFRERLLYTLAALLIVHSCDDGADYVLLLDGDRLAPAAAQHYHKNETQRLLFIAMPPRRLQRLKIVPTDQELLLAQLQRCGIPESQVTIVAGSGESDWDRARALGGWLDSHSVATVTAFVHQFSGRRWQCILRSVLTPEKMTRVRFFALPHRDYDATTWWRSKYGVLDVFNNYLHYGYVAIRGEDAAAAATWDPDEYEDLLKSNRQ